MAAQSFPLLRDGLPRPSISSLLGWWPALSSHDSYSSYLSFLQNSSLYLSIRNLCSSPLFRTVACLLRCMGTSWLPWWKFSLTPPWNRGPFGSDVAHTAVLCFGCWWVFDILWPKELTLVISSALSAHQGRLSWLPGGQCSMPASCPVSIPSQLVLWGDKERERPLDGK